MFVIHCVAELLSVYSVLSLFSFIAEFAIWVYKESLLRLQTICWVCSLSCEFVSGFAVVEFAS